MGLRHRVDVRAVDGAQVVAALNAVGRQFSSPCV
jgi:hypothetical protein